MSAISISNLQESINNLVQQYRTSQRARLVPLQNRQTTLNARLNALGTLKTKLDALNTITEDFASTSSTSKFSVYKVGSSNKDVATATASSGESAGTHSIAVQQLARQDTLLSARIESSSTDIAGAVGPGTHQFTVSVNGVNTEISVSVEESDTNSTLLTKVAQAVNGSGAGVTASVVSDTSTTARLVIKSTESGKDNALILSSGTGGFLNALGWSDEVLNSRSASGTNDAGYLYSSVDTLNSKFIIDGVTVERSSNLVNDVLAGVTISLHKADESPVTLNISTDVEKVRENVEKFIEKYNDALNYVTSRTSVNPANNVREIFAGDMTMRYLRMDLRVIAGSIVAGLDEGAPNSLRDLGISINADGTLTLSDSSKLEAAIQSDPGAAAAVFNSENGIARQLQLKLETFVGSEGLLQSNTEGTNSQLSSLKTRIAQMEQRINIRVDRYKQEFIKLQNQVNIANQQMKMVQSLMTYF